MPLPLLVDDSNVLNIPTSPSSLSHASGSFYSATSWLLLEKHHRRRSPPLPQRRTTQQPPPPLLPCWSEESQISCTLLKKGRVSQEPRASSQVVIGCPVLRNFVEQGANCGTRKKMVFSFSVIVLSQRYSGSLRDLEV